jgi:hypothetical protein
LTYDEIISVADSVTIAAKQSAATLQRNMQMVGLSSPGKNIPLAPHLIRSLRRRVCVSMIQQLQGITINDSFRSLQSLKPRRAEVDRMFRETTQFHRQRTKTDKIINNRFDNDLLRCTNSLRLLPIRGILQRKHQSWSSMECSCQFQTIIGLAVFTR